MRRQMKYTNQSKQATKYHDESKTKRKAEKSRNMEMHSHLSALNETRNDWFLRVRVTGIWNNTSYGILIRYNMILLDCENNHMHAVVAPELWNLFVGIITPGTIYCIRNMNVSPATGLFRPLHSKDMIHFTASTTVVLDLNIYLFIPRHKFHITPLNELRDSFYFYGPENHPVCSTDVVGVVDNLEAMRTVQTRHGSRDLMRFNISYGLQCVSFYSPFPEHYEALYDTQLENPVIVILASTRVSIHIHVHVFVYADNWKYHAHKIVEGGVFVFSNFYTKEALGSLRPVSSKFRINFSPSTNVERVEDDFMIARHKFEFVDLSDLFVVANAYEKPDSPDYSTDVIGVLVDFEHVWKIKTMYGLKDICKFRITDGRDSHKVTVWGNLAVTTDARVREVKAGFKDGEEEPIIVIASSTKLKIWKSSVQISTLPASKIYINLDHDFSSKSFIHICIRLRKEGYVPSDKTTSSPTTTYVKEVVSVIETVTLNDLSEKTSTDFLKMSFMCKVKVKSVEESDNWWYGSCNKNDYHEKVIKFEGKYRCARCQKNYPVPQKRFKIVVLAEDDTKAFNFVLYDRAVKRLLGKTVTNLMVEGYNDPASYPPPLKQIAGREITVKVELTDDNILVSNTIYYAVDAYECSVSTSPVLEDIDTGTSVSNYTNISVPSLSHGAGSSALSTRKRVKKEK
ncbi:replication factor A protein 1-like [Apium graveolens]|uniref:replication factor A protein 1-like n=1 Tax=Apium graveolens TaxID=4045 RepID=UPI003D7B6DDA